MATTSRARTTAAAAAALIASLALIAPTGASARLADGGARETGAAPQVLTQPVAVTVEEGHPASFEATASGSPAPTVQWEREASGATTWKRIAGATSDVLTISSTKLSESGSRLRATFKNTAGEAISEAATLTVANLPKVTKQPASTTVEEGHNAIFESTASGSPLPVEHWEVSSDHGESWTVIAGAEAAQMAVTSAPASDSGNEYRASFTNAAGTVYSNAATLTVQSLPVVSRQPSEAVVVAGEDATFESTSSGTPAATEQWEASSNGGSSWQAVGGATGAVLTIPEAQLSQSGNEYRAAFKNSVGTSYSRSARLVVVAANDTAFGWGMNNRGEVGNGSTEQSVDSPAPVKGLQFVTALAAGMHHSLALTANGRVWAWGFDGHGQLGQIEGVSSRVPVEVELVRNAKAVAAGGSHSLALLENGTVMAWGNDESGQLGNGSHTESEYAVAVPGLSNVTAIAAGEEHSLALLQNGTVMAWGNNERGQLGTGGTASTDKPVAVPGLSDVAAIAAGGDYSLALLENGTVMAWGDDEHGELGNRQLRVSEEEEETSSRSEQGMTSDVPVQVEVSGVRQIAAGSTHALALLEGGTVVAWGQDTEGELGNAAMEARVDTPVPVSGLDGVTQVAAGDQESAALLSSGTVDAWGIDTSGELGRGTTGAASDVPVAVQDLSGAAGIAAGGLHMLAYGATLPTISSISPKAGGTGGGTAVTISGADLGGATAVKFGASAATSFQVDSSTSITAVSPPGSGTVDVTVVTSAGTSPNGAADRFTYRPAPAVSKLSTKGGPASGGTSVTITGTELSGASEVLFGSVAATGLTVDSNDSITVTAPANVSGAVEVRVIAPYGESAATKRGDFKYAPAISSFSPPSAPLAGGATVEVSGAGFALGAATKFTFGHAKAKSVDCTSTTLCLVVAPAQSAAGTVAVVAQANKVKSEASPSDQFTYE